MYFLEKFCFLCLKPGINTTLHKRDVEKKLEYLISTYQKLRLSKFPKHFCDSCLKNLNEFYDFKSKCIRSIVISNYYLQKLSQENNTFAYLSVELSDVLHNIKQDVVNSIDVNVGSMNHDLNTEIFEIDNNEQHETVEIQQSKVNKEQVSIENETDDFEVKREITEELIIKDEHSDNNDDVFKCETCLLTFSKKELLNEHTAGCRKRTRPIDAVNQIQNDIASDDNSEHLKCEPTRGVKVVPAKHKFDKRTSCYYCQKLVLKLPRHLERKHPEEEIVMKFTNLPAKSKERLQIISDLRKRGNYYYNHDCLENRNGSLVVQRRPKKIADGSNFLPCVKCLGYYSKRTLFLHTRNCCGAMTKGYQVQKLSKALLPQHSSASSILRAKILPGLKNDKISKVILSDNLILRFGSELAFKCTDQHFSNYTIRQRMRELGRLLIEIQKLDESFLSLTEMFHPKQCNLLIQAIENLTKFSAETGDCDSPSTIMKLKTSIRMCVEILKSLAIEDCDESERKSLDNFITLFNVKVIRLCSLAKQTIETTKWNKTLQLPIKSKITEFNKYLETQESIYYKKLMEEYTLETWNKLSKIILVKIILFNRRRLGEAQMMRIEEFDKRHTVTDESEIYKNSTETEKNIAHEFLEIQVPGKHRTSVPILINKNEVDIINLILKYREQAGVSEENPYVFGRKCKSFLKGSDAMRLLDTEAKMDYLDRIRSINLREQIASQVQAKKRKTMLARDNRSILKQKGKSIGINEDEGNETQEHITLGQDKQENEFSSTVSNDLDSNMKENLKLNKKFNSSCELEQHIETEKNWDESNIECDKVTEPNKENYVNMNEKQSHTPKKRGIVDIATNSKINLDMHNNEGHNKQISSINEKYNLVQRREQENDIRTEEGIKKRKEKLSLPERGIDDSHDDSDLDPDYDLSPKKLKYSNNTDDKETRRTLQSGIIENEEVDYTSSDEDSKSVKNCGRTKWLTSEKLAIKRHLAEFLLRLEVPGKADCLRVISSEPVLRKRSWRSIKSWVHNTNQTTRRRIENSKKKSSAKT